jgi:HEAT repeat protein
MTHTNPSETILIAALGGDNEAARLKAALTIGTYPDPSLIDTLVARCAVEPSFYVRDMLTWAITRFPSNVTLPRLLAQLRSEGPSQARSQALHTLSKIGDSSAWPAITKSLLHDADDEVARSAWRAAIVLVPETQKTTLAEELATQLGRGNREMQLSLSRALIALGEETVVPILKKAMESQDPNTRVHASATERLLHEPDAGSEFAVNQVKRILAPSPNEVPE